MLRRPALTVTIVLISMAMVGACSGSDTNSSSAGSPANAAIADMRDDPLAKQFPDLGATILADPAVAAVVAEIERDPGGLDPEAVTLLRRISDDRETLAAGLRQLASGQPPDPAAVTASASITGDPWLAAQPVPTDPAVIGDRIARISQELASPLSASAPELDPDAYVFMRNATLHEGATGYQSFANFAGKVDDLATQIRAGGDLTSNRVQLTPMFLHVHVDEPTGAGTASSTSSTTTPTTSKVGSAHRSASAARQPDAKGCEKLRDEVKWDVFKLLLTLAGIGGSAAVPGAGVILAVALSYGAFAAALHDLDRDRQARDDPDGPCGPGRDRGDPHVQTLDHLAYDPQAVGEFVLSSTGADGETVQVRHEPFVPDSRNISTVTAVAADVAGDRVSISAEATGPVVRVGGTVTTVGADGITLPNGGRVVAVEPHDLRIVWPSGSILRAFAQSRWISISYRPAPSLAGTSVGLLGNDDGNPDNDLVTRAGAPIPSKPDHAQLYDQFLNSWRITDAESLFDYAPGQSTATFTDLTFPNSAKTTADLTAEQRTSAEAACSAAGLTDAFAHEECLFDVGFSGDTDFAIGLADSLGLAKTTVSSAQLAEGSTYGDIAVASQVDSYAFDATAGEIRYFSHDDACRDSKLTGNVVDASGTTLTPSRPHLCNDIGRVRFATAGTYRLLIASDHGAVGHYGFSWNYVTDQTRTLGAGPVAGQIDAKGQIDSYTFDATAGQVRTFTHDAACKDSKLTWNLVDPNGKSMTPSTPRLCTDIGTVTLPTGGTYRLEIASYNGSVGTYAFSAG